MAGGNGERSQAYTDIESQCWVHACAPAHFTHWHVRVVCVFVCVKEPQERKLSVPGFLTFWPKRTSGCLWEISARLERCVRACHLACQDSDCKRNPPGTGQTLQSCAQSKHPVLSFSQPPGARPPVEAATRVAIGCSRAGHFLNMHPRAVPISEGPPQRGPTVRRGQLRAHAVIREETFTGSPRVRMIRKPLLTVGGGCASGKSTVHAHQKRMLLARVRARLRDRPSS